MGERSTPTMRLPTGIVSAATCNQDCIFVSYSFHDPVLKTYSRRSTQIQQDLALLQESIFLVQLDQLESSSGAVSLLLGQLVPLVETAFSMFLLDTHDGVIEVAGLFVWCSLSVRRRGGGFFHLQPAKIIWSSKTHICGR